MAEDIPLYFKLWCFYRYDVKFWLYDPGPKYYEDVWCIKSGLFDFELKTGLNLLTTFFIGYYV